MAIGRVDATFSEGERAEMRALGLLDAKGKILQFPKVEPQVTRRAITNHGVLNEAFAVLADAGGR